MSVQAKCLVPSVFAEISDTNHYQVPTDKRAIIDKFTLTNISGSTVTVSVNLVPNGLSAVNENLIMKNISVSAGVTEDVEKLRSQIMNSGDFISVIASAVDAVVIRASGREAS